MTRGYEGSIRLLSVLMVGLGLAVLIRTLSAGGGVLSLGVIFGVLVALLGAGRLYLAYAGARSR